MKRVIFMRHGKAEDGSLSSVDLERSLTSKGKDVSRLMARKLKEKVPDAGVLITSPAFRAIETALIFASEFGVNPEKIRISNDIYFRFNEKTFLNLLKDVNEDEETITLFGHNPSLTDLSDYFSREACYDLPKSGIICLTFNIKTWSEVKPGTGIASLFYKPNQVL
jgi:phosphohistidine phosphatase